MYRALLYGKISFLCTLTISLHYFFNFKSSFDLVLLKLKHHQRQEIITVYNLLPMYFFFLTDPNHTLVQLRVSQAGDSR